MSSYYEKFIATGEVKCIDEEIPFEIPQGWEWCRISDVCVMQAGKNMTADKIFSEPTEAHPYRCVGGNGLRGYVAEFNTEGNHAIVGRQGALCGCLNVEVGNFYATEHAVVVSSYGNIHYKFMYWFLMALNLNRLATATAQPGLSVAKVMDSYFPLPPLPEQQRIITKIEELMPFINKFDKAQISLNILNLSMNELLKKSILQQAIQGKLVEQCSGDEPASELLNQIKAEKKRLVKEGKLKKSALTDAVIFKGDDNKYYEQIGGKVVDITDDIPFEIPQTWKWCRFGTIVKMRIGKTPSRGEQIYWSNGTHNWVSISDMVEGGTIKTVKEKVSDMAVNEIFKCYPSPKGSLLMSFKLTVGRTSILGIDAYHNEAIITIVPYADVDNIFRDYLFYILPTISNSGDSKDAIKGKTLNGKSLNSLLIPLPPLLEQKRIVAKINLVNSKIKA